MVVAPASATMTRNLRPDQPLDTVAEDDAEAEQELPELYSRHGRQLHYDSHGR
jgi:hypothetical protein